MRMHIFKIIYFSIIILQLYNIVNNSVFIIRTFCFFFFLINNINKAFTPQLKNPNEWLYLAEKLNEMILYFIQVTSQAFANN